MSLRDEVRAMDVTFGERERRLDEAEQETGPQAGRVGPGNGSPSSQPAFQGGLPANSGRSFGRLEPKASSTRYVTFQDETAALKEAYGVAQWNASFQHETRVAPEAYVEAQSSTQLPTGAGSGGRLVQARLPFKVSKPTYFTFDGAKGVTHRLDRPKPRVSLEMGPREAGQDPHSRTALRPSRAASGPIEDIPAGSSQYCGPRGNVEVWRVAAPNGHAAKRPRTRGLEAFLARPGRGKKPGRSRTPLNVGSAPLRLLHATAEGVDGSQGQRKRTCPADDEGPLGKRMRTNGTKGWTLNEQADALASVVCHLEDQHEFTERLSREQTWCVPIPHEKKVSTARNFYRAFHDKRTLPIHTCSVCYRKRTEQELGNIAWEEWELRRPRASGRSPFTCPSCFPSGSPVAICGECERYLSRGSLSPASQLHTRLGCEHMFPEELKGLSPVEEKLIAPNSCYGLFTRHSVSTGQRLDVKYPKHIKGHVTVFPNNVQELVTDVLPHPLLRVMDEICVSWQGPEKPSHSDLSGLLSVRRRVVERALVWLKRHNPHYANIRIDTAEMDSWGPSVDGVPAAVYGRMERHEPSAWEKTRTAHVVPLAERGLDEEGPVAIEEILASLTGEQDPGEGDVNEDRADKSDEAAGSGRGEGVAEVIDEVTSSGMFPLDGAPNVADAEKLRFACHAVSGAAGVGRAGPSARIQTSDGGPSATGDGGEAFISVSRGDDFADSSEAAFFAKTFPTLLPFGLGGPKLAEEDVADGAAPAYSVMAFRASEGETGVGALVASRNLHLRAWADIVLRRHGGRFATHHIFAFLVFNMGVRSRNRRASMLSVTRKNFRNVERIVQSMTAERLAAASVELEKTGKTNDDGVKELLRSLSLYGHRQPMSREGRLTMRRKIQSNIVVGGVPAIWYTLNPNDLTNPVKLRLAAYRIHDARAAEALLETLENAYRRTRLAVSDPASSAIFFHREMALFFEKYVNVGGESVFGRISHYFGAVETNERGALHVHGLLWLQGNARLASAFDDVSGEGGDGYRERIARYVDSVFSEVMLYRTNQLVRDGW